MQKERNINTCRFITLKDKAKEYPLMEQKDMQVNTYVYREKNIKIYRYINLKDKSKEYPLKEETYN